AGWVIARRRPAGPGPAGAAAPAADPGCSPTLPKGLFWRRFLVLVVLVVSLNGTWHFFRVWLPLFFQREHGYSERAANVFFIGYYVAADLGSLAAGFLSLRLARRGLPVHVGRMVTFFLFACLTLLSLVAARLPAGPALWGVLWVIGFGALGCFPTYYSFTQELTTRHQGKVTGALGCLSWISMALLHEGVGKSVEMSGSSAHAVAWVGLAPLAAFLVIWLFWGRVPTTP
ncbi:MAG: MFS transporter, partial [Gemmataceae bacterium]|nr:MFS transporter [Gemmataceae bacterium]MDW8264837.1 MFS transporter [Gemmataceae bacterium]